MSTKINFDDGTHIRVHPKLVKRLRSKNINTIIRLRNCAMLEVLKWKAFDAFMLDQPGPPVKANKLPALKILKEQVEKELDEWWGQTAVEMAGYLSKSKVLNR